MRIFLSNIFFIITLTAVAQDVVVTTDAPGVVRVGEQFRITWTVNSRGGDLEPPEFTDFYLLMGPSTSFSQSSRMVNGRITTTIQNSFTYYLQATKEGKFTLPAARYTDRNKEYFSREVTIEVLAADSGAGSTVQPGNNTSRESVAGSGSTTNNGSDLYVRLLLNRTSVTMGEHIVATLKIYSKINLSGIQEVSFPDFNGFLKSDLETEPLRALERENVGGEIYNTGVLQRFLLYPQKTGKLEIEPSSLTVLIQQRVKSNDPFFGDFFSSYNTIPKVIATLPVTINVAPLPSTDLKSFKGAVGSVSISSSLSRDSLDVNDALTYRVSLSGKGNLRLAGAPEFRLSPDIEVYDPKVVQDISATSQGNSGTKTFEYVLIPRHHGQYTVPAVEYSYFDPDRGRYLTLKTEPHSFFVRRTENSDSGEPIVFGGVSKEGVSYLGKDIRYIRTDVPRLKTDRGIRVSAGSILTWYLSLLAIATLILIWRREHVRRNSDLAKVRNRKAGKMAGLRLKNAFRHMKQDNSALFYAEILSALWGYLGDKLGIPSAEIALSQVVSKLAGKGVSEDILENLTDVVQSCEFARYAPDSLSVPMEDIYKRAEKLIKTIENAI